MDTFHILVSGMYKLQSFLILNEFFQAFLSYLPYKTWQDMEGGEIPSLCAGLNIFIKKDARAEKVEKLKEVSCKNLTLKEIYLLTYLLTYSGFCGKKKTKNLLRFFFSIPPNLQHWYPVLSSMVLVQGFRTRVFAIWNSLSVSFFT